MTRHRQAGYALLMAIFFVATLLLLAAMATPSVLTQGRREREQETIWRGNQYVRAIQLYYRKNGRYPQTMEDLTKGSLGVHFLRKSYTDPMNSADGSWRLIYVTPSGQLIGSVRYHSLQEMALKLAMPGAGQALPNPAATAAQAGQPGAAQQGAPPQGAAPQGAGQQNTAAQPGASGQAGAPAQGAQGIAAGLSPAQPAPAAPLEAVDGPVLGGAVVGVASKVKRSSLIVYQGGKTYFEWEFIWNPLSVVGVTAQPAVGAQPNGAVPPIIPPGLPGQNGPANSPNTFPQIPLGGGANPLGMPPLTNPPAQ